MGIYDSIAVQNVLTYKWETYGYFIHYCGAYMHMQYIFTVILYIYNTYLKNDYDEIESFVSPTIIRKDESLVTALSLDGQLNQILPFFKRFDKKNTIFYSLNIKQSDVSSNILNHDIARNYGTIGLTKRLNLNGLF